MKRFLAALALGLATARRPWHNSLADPQNTLYLDTKDGRVTIRLRPDLAPKHVEQIRALTKRGFYDGVVFHRVIDGFMAQTGDPTGTGTGKSDLPNIPAEFTSTPYRRGSVGMARSPEPGLGQFAVLHLLRRLRSAHRPIHAVRRGRLRHGGSGQDQEGQRVRQWSGPEPGPHREDAGRRGREVTDAKPYGAAGRGAPPRGGPGCRPGLGPGRR